MPETQHQMIIRMRREKSLPRVLQGEVPMWWRRILWGPGRGLSWQFGGMGMCRWAAETSLPSLGDLIFDHFGTSVGLEGEDCLVGEPYPQGEQGEQSRMAVEFAKAAGVHVRECHDRSWWFPGWTLRYEFYECTHDPVCDGIVSRQQLHDECRRFRKGLR